jgi:cutinase
MRLTTPHSQGTAVVENAISALSAEIKARIAGVVLFGYTKNGQTKSSIPNFPKEKVKVLCRADDGVCGGALLVTAGHFGYLMDGSGTTATNFLVQQINAMKSSG